jgi:hypothetical protein
MKKRRKAKLFLEELRKTPVVNAVCKQVDITRQTVYRWLKEDPDFKREYEECLSQGVDNVNDLATSQVINKIKQGDTGMTKYWLSHNHQSYMRKQDIPVKQEPKTLADLLRESLAKNKDTEKD